MKLNLYKKNSLNWKIVLIKLSIIVAIVLCDLLTKIYFENKFESVGEFEITAIPYVFSFVFVKNKGAAYSIFSNNTLALTIITAFLVVFLIFADYYANSKNPWFIAGSSMFIAGAIGNLADRVFLGYVRDFIKLDFMNFPIFNLADTFLTIGVILYAVYIIFFLRKEEDAFIFVDKNK